MTDYTTLIEHNSNELLGRAKSAITLLYTVDTLDTNLTGTVLNALTILLSTVNDLH